MRFKQINYFPVSPQQVLMKLYLLYLSGQVYEDYLACQIQKTISFLGTENDWALTFTQSNEACYSVLRLDCYCSTIFLYYTYSVLHFSCTILFLSCIVPRLYCSCKILFFASTVPVHFTITINKNLFSA